MRRREDNRDIRQIEQDLRYLALLANGGLAIRGADLIRRDAETTGPDGFPTSVGGSATSTISTHSIGSSTETAGIRLVERGVDHDPIHTYRVTFVAAVHDALGRLLDADNACKAAEKIARDSEGRQSTITQCLNRYCGRDILGTERDRPRAGRCEACYRWWQEHDHEDNPNPRRQSP